MSISRRDLIGGLAAVGLPFMGDGAVLAQGQRLYTADRSADTLTVNGTAGQPVLRYVTSHPSGEPRPTVEGACYLHPLYTPKGEVVTDVAPKDHPHHRGVFCAWLQVEGEKPGDWWGWGAKAPKDGRKVVNQEARLARRSAVSADLRIVNLWQAEGTTVLTEELDLTVSQIPSATVVDYAYRFVVPTRKSVVIAQSPFGGFCYRAKPRGSAVVTNPDGKEMDLPNSRHDRKETNWPAARWYDLSYTQADGSVTGVALLNHPKNPLTTWHVVRNIHMLNPCIVAEGPVTIEHGRPLELRYRLVAHDGPASAVDLHQLFEGLVRKG